MHYLIDVDTGIDDAMGLLLLRALTTDQVIGVLTVSGNVHLEKATLNTAKVLTFLDWPLPLYRGASSPLVKEAFDASDIHGKDGLAGQLADFPVEMTHESIGPVEAILRASRRYDDLVYIATGPATNLALALKADETLGERLQAIYLMGGALDVPGNVTDRAEFNVYCDPEATRTVLSLGQRVHLIGLDVTGRARLRRSDLDALSLGRIRTLVEGLSADYMKRYAQRRGEEALLLHDPLAVYTALAHEGLESVVTFEKTPLTVGTTEKTRGELRRAPGGGGAVVCVAVDIDESAFIKAFVDALETLESCAAG